MSRRTSEAESEMVYLLNIAVALGIGLTDSALRNSPPVFAESAAGDIAGKGNQGPRGEGVLADPPGTTKASDVEKSSTNVSLGPGDLKRKLLKMRRKLMLNMKHFLNSPTLTSCSQFDVDAVLFEAIKES